MSATMNSKKFFFINKSENSTHLSQSHAAEKAAIQRYVQTGRKRGRKTANKSLEKPNNVSTPVNIARSDASDGTVTRTVSSYAEHAYPNQPTSRAGHQDQFEEDHQDFEDDIQWHLTSSAFQTILNKRDPFDAASVAIDTRVAGLIHYYMYYYHPSQWPNEMALLQKGVYTFQGAVVDIMRTAIADRLAMYCLLAAAACRLQFVDRLPCPPIVGTENHYMRAALQLMSSYIPIADTENPAKLRQLLNSIGFLGSAEAYRGNIAGCKTHFDAQIQILELAGGLSVIDDEHLRGHLAMADLFLACMYLQPCKFDPWYDPGPASSLNLGEDELRWYSPQSTAKALLDRSDDFLPDSMREMVQNLVESHTIKRQIVTSSMSPNRAMQVTHWITMRNMAIRNNLLSLELTDSRHHCLRLSMIMWSLFTMNVTGRAKTVKVMARELSKSLTTIPSSEWDHCEDIEFWIVLTGYYCAIEGSQEESCFINRISENLGRTTLSSTITASGLAEILEHFQQNFFWDSSTQQNMTMKLARMMRSADNCDLDGVRLTRKDMTLTLRPGVE